ncbi:MULTISPECIES: exosporium protein C [unclassified Bacillus (in: firmicutes)]|uniref:exosporium protein C n=1 Tax=unclassified Bacillus (in: firmicutes) TaxID=185979 RepID=UPI003D1FE0FE
MIDIQANSISITYFKIEIEEVIIIFRIIDYQATEPLRKVDEAKAFTIPQSPKKVKLAELQVHIPKKHARENHVELILTVGIKGITGIAQIVFRVFRDDQEIFMAQQGIESVDSEQFYIVTFQAIDTNVKAGSHKYRVTAENITKGTTAAVVGPLSFSALAIAKDHDCHE